MDDDYDWVPDPRVVETRAMDLLELAVEVTARPDAEPEELIGRRSVIDIELDPVAPTGQSALGRPDIEVLDDAEHAGDEGHSDGWDDDPDAAGVDPRMAERRSSVAASSRRRIRNRLLGVVGLAAVGGLGFAALHSPLLDVDEISIIGSDQLSVAELRERTGVGLGSPIAFVDPEAVEAKLRRDPRFVRVVVNRTFPSSLSVRLTNRRPIAVVVGPNDAVVVGENGMIIAVAEGDEFLQHVEVTTDPPTEVGTRLAAPIAAAVDVLGSLSYEVAVQIQRMQITDEGELVFDLGEDRKLLFGTVEDADRKLVAVATMLGPQIDRRGMCQIDVRVPTAPTLRRDPDCDPPPPTTVPETLPPADPGVAVDPAAPVDPAAAVDPGAPVDPAAAVPVDPAAVDPAATPSTTVAP